MNISGEIKMFMAREAKNQYSLWTERPLWSYKYHWFLDSEENPGVASCRCIDNNIEGRMVWELFPQLRMYVGTVVEVNVSPPSAAICKVRREQG